MSLNVTKQQQYINGFVNQAMMGWQNMEQSYERIAKLATATPPDTDAAAVLADPDIKNLINTQRAIGRLVVPQGVVVPVNL